MSSARAKRPKIYLAGPMTGSGDPYENIRDALKYANWFWHRGWCPIIPQSNVLWSIAGAPFRGPSWLEYDFELLAGCEAVFRIEGVSPGADAEVALAMEWGLPVFDRNEMPPRLLPAAEDPFVQWRDR